MLPREFKADCYLVHREVDLLLLVFAAEGDRLSGDAEPGPGHSSNNGEAHEISYVQVDESSEKRHAST